MEILMIYLLIILISAALIYGTWVNGHFDRNGVKNVKPRYPYIGNIIEIITRSRNFTQILDGLYKKFPNEAYVGFFEFGKPNIIIKDLNLLREIGMKEFDTFHDHRTYVDGDADPIFGNFLITLKGQKWRDMRTVLTPAFTGLKLKGMYQFIWKCGIQLSDYFAKEIENSNQDNGLLEIDINHILKRYTSDIISTTAFGIENNSLENPDNKILNYGSEIAHLSVFHMMKFLLHSAFPRLMKFFNISIYKKNTIKYFNNLVHSLINYREANSITRADMIQLLLEAKKEISTKSEKKWTDYDITAQAVLLFIAGFDSTSLLPSFLIHELANYPETQERLHREIDEVMACNDEITFDVINEMKYMDMVVSEALRLWPIVGCIDRVCLKDYEIPKEYNSNNIAYKIKKSQSIWIPLYSIQRDPKYFPNPDEFIPERFSDENKSSINNMAYMPFGVGPRRCIGVRYALVVIKVAIFQLLSKYEFVITDKTPIPIAIDPNSYVLQSKDGFQIGIRERHNKSI